MNCKLIAGALTCAALSVAAPASAATFTFTNATSNVFKADGITVNVFAFSTPTNAASSGPQAAKLGMYGPGLGVVNDSERSDEYYRNAHTIDNGYNGYDFVALYFSQAVNLTGMTRVAYAVDGGSATNADADYWVSSGSTSSSWSDFLGNGKSYASNIAYSSNRAASVWLIGASRDNTDRTDGFKLAGITANAAVPEPSTWAMMLVGFGAVGVTMRRRSSRTTFAIA